MSGSSASYHMSGSGGIGSGAADAAKTGPTLADGTGSSTAASATRTHASTAPTPRCAGRQMSGTSRCTSRIIRRRSVASRPPASCRAAIGRGLAT
eukprot:3814132-Prymnesium_polylepis.1